MTTAQIIISILASLQPALTVYLILRHFNKRFDQLEARVTPIRVDGPMLRAVSQLDSYRLNSTR